MHEGASIPAHTAIEHYRIQLITACLVLGKLLSALQVGAAKRARRSEGKSARTPQESLSLSSALGLAWHCFRSGVEPCAGSADGLSQARPQLSPEQAAESPREPGAGPGSCEHGCSAVACQVSMLQYTRHPANPERHRSQDSRATTALVRRMPVCLKSPEQLMWLGGPGLSRNVGYYFLMRLEGEVPCG